MTKQPFDKKKLRPVIGIVLMLAGIAVSFLQIKYQYDDCAYRWHNNLDGFGLKYASAWDCFITRSTGMIVASLIVGIFLFVIGYDLIRRKPKTKNN